MKNNLPPTERNAFNDLLERVSNLEADKDAFLKAARLQRIERQPMSDGRFETLCVLIGLSLLMVCVAAVMIVFHVC